MERLRSLLERFQKRNTYRLPFPEGTQVSHTLKDPAIIDFYVPLRTPVLAPQDGIIAEVVDDKALSGPTVDFIQSLNFIVISHANGEYSRVEHLKKESARVEQGKPVRKGQVIAETGESGQMTTPHLGFSVFKIPTKGGFKEITPIFDKEIK